MSTPITITLKRNFLPTTELAAWEWLTNFKTELPRFAAAMNITGTRPQALYNAYLLLEKAREYARNAADLYHERVAEKDLAAWAENGVAFNINPFTATTGPANKEVGNTGAFTLAVRIADDILANPACNEAVRAALRLNPIPAHSPAPGSLPQFKAFIEQGRLTVAFTKAHFKYFIIRVDHATGTWDTETPALTSPWHDPRPLPTDAPEIWRVQLVGFQRDGDPGYESDIIDVAAKQSYSEHAEGAR